MDIFLTKQLETAKKKLADMKANPSPRKFYARDYNRLLQQVKAEEIHK